ncbi:MAG: aspartate kinase [Bacteroidales bacterium]|nr:aspartate kinase [Bacteroidales bacterium]
MKVLKFGGTSVGTAERIRQLLPLVNDGEKKIIVLSAMAGTTSKLEEIGKLLAQGHRPVAAALCEELREHYLAVTEELFGKNGGTRTTDYSLEPGADGKAEKQAKEKKPVKRKNQDKQGENLTGDNENKTDKQAETVTEGKSEAAEKALASVNAIFSSLREFTLQEYSIRSEKSILAAGEMLSTELFHLYARSQGADATLVSALNFMRIDKDGEPDAFYIHENLEREMKSLEDKILIITQGYICRNAFGEIDNLKRGGSDYTATLIGAAIKVSEVQIWTDINGVHNNDPRYVRNTQVIRHLSYDEAAELAYFGAKILHPSSVLPVRALNIPVILKNTMEPSDRGTIIGPESKSTGYKAVAGKDGITVIRIKSDRMLLAYGFLRKIFEVFELFRTPIDMITTSEVAVSLTIDDTGRLEEIREELALLGRVEVDHNQSIICIVGNFIAETAGTTPEIFNALSGIPLRMISYGGSRHNVSVVVDSNMKTKALNRLGSTLFKENSDDRH